MRDSTAEATVPSGRLSRRALVVWFAAVIAYILAITGRTSLGVAGVEAMDQFHIDASRLAVFTSVQLGVYACAQIPMGMLIDRFGARRMLVVGALMMGLGQVLLGLTTSYPVAIVARVIIGSADATAFLSVMRILPAWIPPREAPVFTQLTGGLGYIGQFMSAVPFSMLLHAYGWSPAFLSLGAGSVLVALLAWVAVADSPFPDRTLTDAGKDRGTDRGRDERRGIRATLAFVVRQPACWLGFFIHFTLMSQVVFTLLWGVPLMTLGMGLSGSQASGILVLNMVVSVVLGPVMGVISGRARRRRPEVTLVATLIVATTWAVFFMSPDPRGLVAVAVVNVIVPGLAPVANYGFDTVREEVDRRFTATATGLSNMGGFLAAMVAAQAAGLVLDAVSDGGDYTWGDFRLAWCALGVVWVFGIVGLLVSRVKMQRWRDRTAAATATATATADSADEAAQ